MKKDCIFCKIIEGELPCKKIYESENFICILDAAPLADGHTLIISKKHFETFLDLPSSLGNELIDNIKKISLKLIKEKKAEGFNVFQNNYEAAQQEIPHFHTHIIPRKKNDNLDFLKRD